MNVRLGALLVAAAFALTLTAVYADDFKSGPSDKIGGASS